MKVELKSLRKSFAQGVERLDILNNLNLQVSSGEVVAIIGASGSGKSTLLSLLAGFDRPNEGEISWEQQSTLKWRDAEWAKFRKSSLGFVFQSYYLIPYLTARENVALPLRLLGMRDADTRASARLNEIGLSHREHHLPRQLSGGESQRVAIARALIHAPALVLADEPTGSLDVHTGAHVLGVLFEQLKAQNQTALIVTHSPEVAARCDRTLTLREGQLWPA